MTVLSHKFKDGEGSETTNSISHLSIQVAKNGFIIKIETEEEESSHVARTTPELLELLKEVLS